MVRRRTSAFNLVDLVAVMALLVSVLAVAVPPILRSRHQLYRGDGMGLNAKSEILALGIALDCFKEDTGSYPTEKDGLQALVDQPGNTTGWKGPYIKMVPNDPWHNPYVYTYPPKHSQSDVDILSAGADGQFGTEDDINNWTTKK